MSGSWTMLAVCCYVLQQVPDAKDPAVEAPSAASVLDAFKVDAADYAIRLDARPDDTMVLRPEPLLHWENPARNGEDGALFVWMLDGRPEVIGTIFTYRYNEQTRRKHEYHSLAAGPLAAEFHGRKVWAPRLAGVTFQPVPDAPAPAARPRLRMTQMKALARSFSVRMEELNEQRATLRLVPQPLIRYEPAEGKIVDGALFSFALGTDPEAILLLEAHEENGASTWQYAFARFHYIELAASYKDREVWHVEPQADMVNLDLGATQYQDSVYATYHVPSE